jgi:hypothetical protein
MSSAHPGGFGLLVIFRDALARSRIGNFPMTRHTATHQVGAALSHGGPL